MMVTLDTNIMDGKLLDQILSSINGLPISAIRTKLEKQYATRILTSDEFFLFWELFRQDA